MQSDFFGKLTSRFNLIIGELQTYINLDFNSNDEKICIIFFMVIFKQFILHNPHMDVLG